MTYEHGPLPDVTDLRFAPFWKAAHEHRIEMPKCEQCAQIVWPPRDTCTNCYSEALRWSEVPTTGEIYSWTSIHVPTVDTMTAPYVVAVITLTGTEHTRLLGNIVDWPADQVKVAMPVRAEFCPVSATCTLVNWVPTAVAPTSI